jgi:hypothetical protein
MHFHWVGHSRVKPGVPFPKPRLLGDPLGFGRKLRSRPSGRERWW